MKINIYYGGRGLIEDPTIFVLEKLTNVLEELRVQVTRYNLFEDKNGISVLPKTLKEADGIILATTVEWLGIGGYMQQFLDACWLYADKEHLSKLYMMPIVTSTAGGEREAELTLIRGWEILGGTVSSGICAYVENYVDFETTTDYVRIIENRTEDFYRAINKKLMMLPNSNGMFRQYLSQSNCDVLSPQESEQLSMYVSDDTYVKKQKEDIEELTMLFKELMDSGDNDAGQEFIKNLIGNFHPIQDFSASYAIQLTDLKRTLVIEVHGSDLKCYYGDKPDADVLAKTTHSVMHRLVLGRLTFQGAFMAGELSAKGNLKNLRTFDLIFQFNTL